MTMGLFNKMKKEFMVPIHKSSAVAFIIIGLIMGTVFMVNATYWRKPIDEEYAIHITAMYLSCSDKAREGHAISLYFSDLQVHSIEAECVTSDLIEKIKELESGTRVNLLVHPNSTTILAMVVNGETILDYTEVMESIRRSNIGHAFFGGLMYSLALFGSIKLFRKEVL